MVNKYLYIKIIVIAFNYHLLQTKDKVYKRKTIDNS